MPPYQKQPNDIGAAWEKINKKGAPYLSVTFDCAHSPETALALANMLLSGQQITFMAALNSRHDGTPTCKVPKYNMYMGQQQHAWMVQTYKQPYASNVAPKFDYRMHNNNPAQPQPTQQTPIAYPPVAPAMQPVTPPTPYPPSYPGMPHAAQVQPTQPTAPVAPPTFVPASSPAVPHNPFGA